MQFPARTWLGIHSALAWTRAAWPALSAGRRSAHDALPVNAFSRLFRRCRCPARRTIPGRPARR
eukprot:6189583-Pleurochrysis_carterae.AAC.3